MMANGQGADVVVGRGLNYCRRSEDFSWILRRVVDAPWRQALISAAVEPGSRWPVVRFSDDLVRRVALCVIFHD